MHVAIDFVRKMSDLVARFKAVVFFISFCINVERASDRDMIASVLCT